MKTPNKKFVFLLVGGLTFAIYYFLLFVLFDLLAIHYLIAIAFSYSLAVIFHFYCNRIFTFKNLEGELKSQVRRYVLLSVVSYLMQTGLITLLYGHNGIDFYLSVFVAVSTCTVVTYIVMNQWVFGKVRE